MSNFKGIFVVSLPAIVFLLVSVTTLSHYGFIWDEPDHFKRGLAYFNYLTTGNATFENLAGSNRSYFQDDRYTANYYFNNDGGHPPLNGILAAASNYVFYQKLGILGDLEALHFFSVFCASLLVLVVSIFAYKEFGLLAGLTSGVSLAVYPLFFGEAHFNIKDPVESTFFVITILAFWNSLKKKNWKWLLVAVISFAVAFSVKFNILFLPFIVLSYFFFRDKNELWFTLKHPVRWFKKLSKPFRVVLIISPFIVFLIFFSVWPYLWFDLGRILEIFLFYKQVGVSAVGEPGIYLPGGFNLYPLVWILSTTPPWILFLGIVGIMTAIVRGVKKKDKLELFLVLWLTITIFRVTIPHVRIYGGVRQIMEYIPAIAMLSGYGASYLYSLVLNKIKIFRGNITKLFVAAVFLLAFIPHILITIKIHPNENVYFNSLIGGIKGARDKHIPFWGNSFGNAYLQAIWWLNENAEKNAKLVLLQKDDSWVSRTMLRNDIQYSAGNYRSGIKREGEYIVELTHDQAMHYYPYVWEYINKFLEPVFEVKVDDVAIAKVWENNLEHTRLSYRSSEKLYEGGVEIIYSGGKDLTLSFSDEILLSRIILKSDAENCGAILGNVQTSINDRDWLTEEDHIHSEQLPGRREPKKIIEFFFAARKARHVQFLLDKQNKCFEKNITPVILILS